MGRVSWILGLGMLGLGLLSCGYTEGGGMQVVQPRLLQTPEGNRAFSGILINSRKRRISIAQVEVALYDESGFPVETIRLEVNDVPAQDSVSFSSPIDSERSFTQAQVKEIFSP